MWAAFKALIQEERGYAPSVPLSHKKVDDVQCIVRNELDTNGFNTEPSSAFDPARVHEPQSSRKSSKSQFSELSKGSDGLSEENGKENGPIPNLPLSHSTSPTLSPNEYDKSTHIQAQAWRICAAEPKALSAWDIRGIRMYERGREACANTRLRRMHCSASASDVEWGQVAGWEVANAFGYLCSWPAHTSGHGWGGRPDENGKIWLGAVWDSPFQVERVKILQDCSRRSYRVTADSGGPVTAESVLIEAQFEDGSWGLVAGPVPLNSNGWTTITLSCAGVKRPRELSREPELGPNTDPCRRFAA